jgi:hypothetical protein
LSVQIRKAPIGVQGEDSLANPIKQLYRLGSVEQIG